MRQPDHPEIESVQLTEVLAALSDPARLAIVAQLARGPARACGEFELPIAKSTLSHHMKILRLAGVITSRADGTRCTVSLRRELEQRFPGLLAKVLELAGERPGQAAPEG